MDKNKVVLLLKIIITIACIVTGLLAGENVYRYVIEVPAWKHINIIYWGEYSRNADLKNGIFLFPLEAILSSLLLFIASALVIMNKDFFPLKSFSLYAATTFTLAGLALTFPAASYMFSVETINDPQLLQDTFNAFHFWGSLRAITQILSFFSCVFALEKIYQLN